LPAEDGIRCFHVTGVQTCALPILFNRGSGFCNGAINRPSEISDFPYIGCCRTGYLYARSKNVYDQTSGEEQKVFEAPEFMKKMVENGWLGAKSGQGFFLKKDKEILELDPETLDYR